MTLIDKINKALANVEPNILGHRYVKIDIDGVIYSAAATTAGSHQSAKCWGRIDYKKDGKKIARAKLI